MDFAIIRFSDQDQLNDAATEDEISYDKDLPKEIPVAEKSREKDAIAKM